MKVSKALLGILAGFAAGTTLGVLFAPAKGKSTRGRISRKARHYADEIRDKSNEITDSVSRNIQAVKDEGARLVENWKHKERWKKMRRTRNECEGGLNTSDGLKRM